jgi:hypothetical protein
MLRSAWMTLVGGWMMAAVSLLAGQCAHAQTFNGTAHALAVQRSLGQCRDFSSPSPGQMRIQYYASKASGCSTFVTMQGDSNFQGFRTATLAFQVYFSPGFSWGKGGKLHGLLGGNTWGNLPCFGGRRQDFCHSARVMWSEGGRAQIYLYVPSAAHKVICNKYPTRIQSWCCNPTFPYGLEMDRGVLNFRSGVWHNVSLTVRLGVGNTSSVTLRVDDKATTVWGIPMQLGSDQSIRRTIFTTFYGGHTPDWFPKFDTFSIFRAWQYRDLAFFWQTSRAFQESNATSIQVETVQASLEAAQATIAEAQATIDTIVNNQADAEQPPPPPPPISPEDDMDAYDPYQDDPYSTDPV